MNESIFAPANKYGYKININHPSIKPLYEKYKKKYKIIIMSDAERHEFESKIFSFINKKAGKK